MGDLSWTDSDKIFSCAFYAFENWSAGTVFEKLLCINSPDSKVHGANMGPIWGQLDPDGPHVGPMNFANWVSILLIAYVEI